MFQLAHDAFISVALIHLRISLCVALPHVFSVARYVLIIILYVHVQGSTCCTFLSEVVQTAILM